MEKKGLVVSWFFPPATSAEGLVTFKLLRRSSYEYDVLSAQSSRWSYASDSPLQSPNIRVHALEASSFRAWVRACVERYRSLAGDTHYDFLMTRAMPPESHIVGLKIKRQNPSLFWVASMADPIGHNPYDYDRYFRRGLRALLKNPVLTAAHVFLYLRNEWFDRRVTKKANLLIYPSMEQCRFTLGKRYQRYQNKVLILPHPFDRELIATAGEPEAPKDERISVCYLGYLSTQRTAEGLIRAAALLLKREPDAAKRLVIRLIGHLPEEQLQLIQNLGVSTLFSVEPPVDYTESLRVMKSAGWLLLIDADFPFMRHNIFMVSKLADYMGVKKPIIGLTTPEGPSAALLRQAGCPVVRPQDAEGICALLRQIISGDAPYIDFAAFEQLDSRKIAETFDTRINDALKKGVNAAHSVY